MPLIASALRRSCFTWLAAGGLALAGLLPADAQEPLLYTATRSGNADLFLGTGSRTDRLTDAEAADNYGAWSPSGRQVAFQSQRDGNYELYVMNADGSGQRNLTLDPGHDGLPVWSPDGARLAFFSSRGFTFEEFTPIPGHIYTMPAAGGEPVRLTAKPLTSTLGPSSWSPDGRYLLLARMVSGDSDLFRLEVATGREERLTASPASEGGARYSPDGASIAYYEETDGSAAVVVMTSNGADRRAVLDDGDYNYLYAWSPDGTRLTVTSINAAGEWSLKSVALDGTIETLVAAGVRAREGSWRPARLP